MILFDALVLRPWFKTGLRASMLLLLWWIGVGMLFNVYIWVRHGATDGFMWCSGYLLEWLLSMDNLFVFHLIFRVFKTPEKLLHKALFWGFVGAVLFRMLFFVALAQLLYDACNAVCVRLAAYSQWDQSLQR